ncbi:hypothetical protein BGW42_002476 [Actinomortierella wolfii]|nr:hypothetical protein BGW42_002476 [Actinomortierella wolfii]
MDQHLLAEAPLPGVYVPTEPAPTDLPVQVTIPTPTAQTLSAPATPTELLNNEPQKPPIVPPEAPNIPPRPASRLGGDPVVGHAAVPTATGTIAYGVMPSTTTTGALSMPTGHSSNQLLSPNHMIQPAADLGDTGDDSGNGPATPTTSAEATPTDDSGEPEPEIPPLPEGPSDPDGNSDDNHVMPNAPAPGTRTVTSPATTTSTTDAIAAAPNHVQPAVNAAKPTTMPDSTDDNPAAANSSPSPTSSATQPRPTDHTVVKLKGKPGYGESETTVQQNKCYIIEPSTWNSISTIHVKEESIQCAIFSDEECKNHLVSASDHITVPGSSEHGSPTTFKCIKNAQE